MNKNRQNFDQLSSSLSIETLEEIVRNCQRNEQRLHELERHTRHERKKAERLLRETYRTKQQEYDKQISTFPKEIIKPKPQQESVEFFIPFDNKDHLKKNHREEKRSHRVRFNIPENNHNNNNNISIEQKTSNTRDDELNELSRRCEQLLLRLHTHKHEPTIFSDDYSREKLPRPEYDDSITLQQALELLRPEFISHSRQRIQHINHLRDEREHQQIHSNSIINRTTNSYQEMKQISKKKYEQLPEVNQRLQQDLINEIRRKNYLRAKIFRLRLRQHVLLHGRTNIDESLTMIDT